MKKLFLVLRKLPVTLSSANSLRSAANSSRFQMHFSNFPNLFCFCLLRFQAARVTCIEPFVFKTLARHKILNLAVQDFVPFEFVFFLEATHRKL